MAIGDRLSVYYQLPIFDPNYEEVLLWTLDDFYSGTNAENGWYTATLPITPNLPNGTESFRVTYFNAKCQPTDNFTNPISGQFRINSWQSRYGQLCGCGCSGFLGH